MEIEKIRIVAAGVFLMIKGFWDLKYKRIPLHTTLVGGAIGLICLMIEKRTQFTFLYSFLPGIVLLLLGKLSKGAIGYGDGIVVLTLGLFCKGNELLMILLLALVFAGVVGLVLLVVFKKKGKYEIPFVPFLFLGWIIERCMYL